MEGPHQKYSILGRCPALHERIERQLEPVLGEIQKFAAITKKTLTRQAQNLCYMSLLWVMF